MPRVNGDICLSGGNNLTIRASFGNGAEASFILDTGNTITLVVVFEIEMVQNWRLFRQINRDMAVQLGLRTHRKLIGYSSLRDGNQKYDYLACCNITVLGVVVPMVVKVGCNSQPVLLGLDLIVALRMNLTLETMKMSILDAPNFNPPSPYFQFVNFALLMEQAGIVDADLEAVETLPLASVAYGQALIAGQNNYIVFLGTSGGCAFSPGVCVGTSYSTTLEAVSTESAAGSSLACGSTVANSNVASVNTP